MIEEEFLRLVFDVRGDVQLRRANEEEIMTTEVMATVENGALKLDGALPFPDQTRVKLTIEPVESENRSAAAWKRLLRLMDEKPIAGLAGKFSREKLYERD